MLKKLTALLLSLLVCLSLLPGQALAADVPDPVAPPVIEEPLDPSDPGDPGDPGDPKEPDDPKDPVMPLSGGFPEGEDGHKNP